MNEPNYAAGRTATEFPLSDLVELLMMRVSVSSNHTHQTLNRIEVKTVCVWAEFCMRAANSDADI